MAQKVVMGSIGSFNDLNLKYFEKRFMEPLNVWKRINHLQLKLEKKAQSLNKHYINEGTLGQDCRQEMWYSLLG